MRYIAVSLILIVLSYFNFLDFLTEISNKLVSYPAGLLRTFALDSKDAVAFVLNLKEVSRQNELLRQENLLLRSSLNELQALKQENNLLKSQLDIEQNHDDSTKLVLASVLGNPNDLTGSSVFLTKGSKAGIQVGDVLVIEDNLVGIVKEVTPSQSLAYFVTSPNILISAFDMDSNTEGVVTGKFGTSLVMTKILPGEKIYADSTIATSGKDGLFPPGLAIGRVTSVQGSPSEPLQTAQLESFVQLSKLRQVFVLLRKP